MSLPFFQSSGIVFRNVLIWSSLDMHVTMPATAYSSMTWICWWNLVQCLCQFQILGLPFYCILATTS